MSKFGQQYNWAELDDTERRSVLQRPAVAANGPRLQAMGSIGLFAWNHVLPHRLVLGPPHGEGFSRVAAGAISLPRRARTSLL